MSMFTPQRPSAEDLIHRLKLMPHPEGGFFRETYRSPATDGRGRAAATAIYFLLPRGHVSKLHRIDADEGWHLYMGGPLEIYELGPERQQAKLTLLGTDFARGEVPQHVVPAGAWFGATPAPWTDYALVGCTVAPGFEFAKFELGKRENLLAAYPEAREQVLRFT